MLLNKPETSVSPCDENHGGWPTLVPGMMRRQEFSAISLKGGTNVGFYANGACPSDQQQTVTEH